MHTYIIYVIIIIQEKRLSVWKGCTEVCMRQCERGVRRCVCISVEGGLRGEAERGWKKQWEGEGDIIPFQLKTHFKNLSKWSQDNYGHEHFYILGHSSVFRLSPSPVHGERQGTKMVLH